MRFAGLELRGRRGRLAHRRHAVERRLILLLQRPVLRDPLGDFVAAPLLDSAVCRACCSAASALSRSFAIAVESRRQLGEPGLELIDRDVIILHGQQCSYVWVHEPSVEGERIRIGTN